MVVPVDMICSCSVLKGLMLETLRVERYKFAVSKQVLVKNDRN